MHPATLNKYKFRYGDSYTGPTPRLHMIWATVKIFTSINATNSSAVRKSHAPSAPAGSAEDKTTQQKGDPFQGELDLCRRGKPRADTEVAKGQVNVCAQSRSGNGREVFAEKYRNAARAPEYADRSRLPEKQKTLSIETARNNVGTNGA